MDWLRAEKKDKKSKKKKKKSKKEDRKSSKKRSLKDLSRRDLASLYGSPAPGQASSFSSSSSSAVKVFDEEDAWKSELSRREESDASDSSASGPIPIVAHHITATEDLNPPRKIKHRSSSEDSQDLNPPRKIKHRSSSEDSQDLNPPRKIKHRNSSEDSQDLNPPRKIKRRSSSEDSQDLNPPRRSRRRSRSSSRGSRESQNSASRSRKRLDSESSSDASYPVKRRRRSARLDSSSDSENEANERQLEKPQRETKRELVDQSQLEKQLEYEWGTGAVDRQKARKVQEDLADAKQRGFAVYADDEKLNEELKQEIRADDPMAAYMLSKRQDGNKKGSTRNVYSGPPPPPNRFGIHPGYRWDGIDRSNGFEQRLLEKLPSLRRM